ncbi:hypothetical protein K523DRAFT_258033, partial [Schizophyllum commune Tattone D]
RPPTPSPDPSQISAAHLALILGLPGTNPSPVGCTLPPTMACTLPLPIPN